MNTQKNYPNNINETPIFQYSYSASRAEEIANIRKKYLPSAEETVQDKLEELRKLDQSVSNKATVCALIVGILSALIMGSGMSLVMVFTEFVWGIIIGVIGMAGVIIAYPLYRYVLEKERAKAAPRVLQLTQELEEN